MFKRNFAVIVVAGLVLGGGAVALAGGGPERPTLVAAQTGETPPSTAPADRRAQAQALRDCLRQAGEDDAARRTCLESAAPGVRHGLKHRRGGGGPLDLPLGRAGHGTAIVPDGNGGWHEVTFDRGTVDEATDGSKIVLDRADGQTATLALTADTKYHGVADAAAIVEGRPALVVSKDGKALHVAQKDPDRRHGPGNKAPAPGVERD